MNEGDGADKPDTPEGSDGSDGVVPTSSRSPERNDAAWRVVNAPPDPILTALWSIYRDGIREAKHLARTCHVSVKMARTAIEYGWPDRNFPPLKERAELWERQAEAARARQVDEDRKAAEATGTTFQAKWRAYQARMEKQHRDLEGIFGFAAKKLMDAAKVATFIRYRKVQRVVMVDDEGRIVERGGKPKQLVEDQAYVDAVSWFKAISLLANGMRDQPVAVKFLLQGLPDDEDLPELTPEQLEQMEKGQMPEGVSEDQIGRLLLAATRRQAKAE